MTAEAYVARRLHRGELTAADVVAFVKAFQTEQGLLVDGKPGDQTMAALRLWSPDFDFDKDHEAGKDAAETDVGAFLMLKTLELNVREFGEGETEGKNNSSARIDFYRETDGTGIGPGGTGAWCSTLQSSSLNRAADFGEVELPCRTSRSAKKLGDFVGAAGRYLSEPEVGAFIVWHRGSNPAQGHIGQVISYDRATDHLVTVEGNKGRQSVVGEYEYPRGEWRDRLYCISTLALGLGLE